MDANIVGKRFLTDAKALSIEPYYARKAPLEFVCRHPADKL